MKRQKRMLVPGIQNPYESASKQLQSLPLPNIPQKVAEMLQVERLKLRKSRQAAAKLVKKRKGKALRQSFEHTNIGIFLMMYAPIEYNLLLSIATPGKPPKADLIETLGYASDNPAFKTAEFRRCLIYYRKFGVKIIPGDTPKRNVGKSVQEYVNERKMYAEEIKKVMNVG